MLWRLVGRRRIGKGAAAGQGSTVMATRDRDGARGRSRRESTRAALSKTSSVGEVAVVGASEGEVASMQASARGTWRELSIPVGTGIAVISNF